MKAIELRETYADTLLRKGYLKLPEHSLVNKSGEGPYFNGSAMTPNIGYFLGTQERPANAMFTQQRVYWTRFADLLPTPFWTLFQVMMSYYQFEQPSLQHAFDLGVELLTEVLGISKHDILVLAPRDPEISRMLQQAGVLGTNIVTWERVPQFAVEDQLKGFYCKFMVKHKHGMLPLLDIVNITGPDGKLMVDSCMLLERMAFRLQDKQTWFETEMFLPLMQKIEELEGTRAFADPFVYPYAAKIRSLVAVLADGGDITGKGKGYVLKKTLRQLLQEKAQHGFETPLHHYVRPSLACLQSIGYDWMEEAEQIEETFRAEEDAFRKWHAGAERFLLKQVQLLEQGRRQPVSAFDLLNWKDSRGVPEEMADEFLTSRGVVIEGYEREIPVERLTFADAYHNDVNRVVPDAKQWLIDFETRRLLNK
ncbi:MAG: alanine--tRNA ligase-related protein [Tumebacillaceae bacterium]